MNYISELNSFWDSVMIKPLSTGQVSLYLALLNVCNRSNWTEWFSIPNQSLSVLTGLSKSGILKARNELRQKGYIDFKERGTKATMYKIITRLNSNRDSVRVSNLVSVRDGVRNSNPLYKQKQNETIKPPISPVMHFEDFWDAYPKKKNRTAAETAYCKCLLDNPDMAEDQLVNAAVNYADAVAILGTTERYVKNPQNFLADGYYVDYLDENYVPGSTRKPSGPTAQFNQFMQNDYDFEQLEKEIVSN